MRGYGLPRDKDIEAPDMGDIKEFALASHAARFPGKGGDIRSCFRSAADKARVRRIYAHRARAEGRALCRAVD